MKKTILVALMSITLFSACKEKHHTPPPLNAVRAAEMARKSWAKNEEIVSPNTISHEVDTTNLIHKNDSSEMLEAPSLDHYLISTQELIQ